MSTTSVKTKGEHTETVRSPLRFSVKSAATAAALVIVVAAIAATVATAVAAAIAAARVMVAHHHILGRSLAHLDDLPRKLERLAGHRMIEVHRHASSPTAFTTPTSRLP